MLYISYSDFIPEGLKRFKSKLFPVSERDFGTKIPDMNINFSDIDGSVSNKLILTWQGDTVTFNRAKEGYTIRNLCKTIEIIF